MSGTAFATTTNRRSWFTRAVPGLIVAGGSLATAIWNPGDSDMTICFSKRLFGIDCPGCGGLRTVNSLMHGDLVGALDHNVILAVLLPVVAVVWLFWFLEPLTGRRIRMPNPPAWTIVSITVGLLAFTVLRNLDGPAWAEWLAASRYN